jgi:hypothetical protein
MVQEPELRERVAQIRDRARRERAEYQRHSKPPDWDLVRDTILDPLAELEQRLGEEIVKRQSKDALVPIDRDPVPRRFADQVEKYYERLGSGD